MSKISFTFLSVRLLLLRFFCRTRSYSSYWRYSVWTFTEICEETEKLKVVVNLDPCVKYKVVQI